MPESTNESTNFITELDAAVEAHMDWTRRVLRCAVLHESPGNDVLAPLAHTLCHFGCWFVSNKAYFEKLDPQNTQKLEAVHHAMHDAIRSICADVLAKRPGQNANLVVFEQTQSELIKLLAEFKTQFLAIAVQYDALTGLPLRHYLEDEFFQMQKDCKRHKKHLYVFMFDVDHFKKINDSFGHQIGDIALCHLANVLKNTTRPCETLYRYGGEEFILLMQCATSEGAVAAAQRFIKTVRSAPVPIPQGEPLALTITLGLAKVNDDELMASAIARADKALYQGKSAGRNRYILFDDQANALTRITTGISA